ncbi:hypothetical protein ACFWIW_36310 [Amycolatopsis sp. NPDC058340]|uniref:hypothetical protein n=1 Tax=Amycolatopsis sp. NPDC058340 TaxID=3346453 RepID=UPI003659B526
MSDPEATEPELSTNDGTISVADIVNRTFAVEIAANMVGLRDTQGRPDVHDPDSPKGRAEFEQFLSDMNDPTQGHPRSPSNTPTKPAA